MSIIRRTIMDFANQPEMVGRYEDELNFELNGEQRTMSVVFHPGIVNPAHSYPGLMNINTVEIEEYSDGENVTQLDPQIFITLFTTDYEGDDKIKSDRIDAIAVRDMFLVNDHLGDEWIHVNGAYILTRNSIIQSRLNRASTLKMALNRNTHLPNDVTHKISGFLLKKGDRNGGRRKRTNRKKYGKKSKRSKPTILFF